MEWDWNFTFQIIPRLLPATLNTLIAAGLGYLIALVLGLALALAQRSRFRAVNAGVREFVEFVRSTPLLLQIYFVFYVGPQIGIWLSPWTSGMITIGIHYGAYLSEVYRGGIESVPTGQFEAAAALGLPFLITLRKVVLPQALRIVIPPTTSNCVSMFKDTALASTVALPELLKEATDAQALHANPTPLIGAALIYIACLWPMVRFVSLLEKKFQKEKKR